nr:hypothetical protein Iba_chr03aCG7530 [Ipomoea batatas]
MGGSSNIATAENNGGKEAVRLVIESGFSRILYLSGVISINHEPGKRSCKNPIWKKIGIEVRNGENQNLLIMPFNYINLLLNSSGPIFRFYGWFDTGNGYEISFNLFYGERAIENLLFCGCAKFTTFPSPLPARQLRKVHGQAVAGFLIAIVDDVRPFPFSGVHGSRTEISHQLLADNLDIVVASDVGFNRGNLLHLIANVVLLGVINGRVAQLHTEVFQVTLFKA